MMRDAFIESLLKKMSNNRNIFFLSADFGAPTLDKLKTEFSDRFINVGIAEQNLINIATGLALEGYVVYAYAIAPFLSMRAYEQIRNNLSLMSQIKKINVNLIGVGAGVSYDVTGPSHHCLEDTCAISVLPNITLFSPSDTVLCKKFVDYTLEHDNPKYIRLDGKPLPEIYNGQIKVSFEKGFSELRKGKRICVISTGFMTHHAIKLVNRLDIERLSAGLVDLYMLKPLNEKALIKIISDYDHVVTMEEGFINKGGLDTNIEHLCFSNKINVKITKMGFGDRYIYDVGDRDYFYKLNGLDIEGMLIKIKKDLE